MRLFYKIPPEHVIVLSDDVSLDDVARCACAQKARAGGQNGLKNIIYHLNSEDFPRVKIGVGKSRVRITTLQRGSWQVPGGGSEGYRQGVRGRSERGCLHHQRGGLSTKLPRRNSTENASGELVLMKTAVAYYRLGGTTRSYARAEAKARNADLIELTPKTPGMNRFTAFCARLFEAVKQKAVAWTRAAVCRL
ncbi:hypothetical protein [Agathobaculum butyriciproducens]|uniref:hypothetical protein n=1 Tax=Agathobaculum butyriciproducens TaxID=1628085 RepID=UPI0036D2865C